MFKLFFLILPLSLLLADGPVLKTGQTTVYKVNDDGRYQTGITRSYTRDDVNGTVTDNATHLEWQDDAVGSPMTWANAITHCDGLTLDGKIDWRLPTQKELRTLVDNSRINSSIDPVFQNVASNLYWSSTTYAGGTSSAWYVNFGSGDDRAYGKTVNNYVRCVRSGQ